VTEGDVSSWRLGDLISAPLEADPPRCGRGPFEADERRAVELPDVKAGRVIATERPAPRLKRLSWCLGVHEQADQKLEKNLGLRVSTHGSENGVERVPLICDHERGESVRWAPARPVLRRVGRLQ
jgi:hypothetical protein